MSYRRLRRGVFTVAVLVYLAVLPTAAVAARGSARFEEDEARAEKAVLALSDFASGWGQEESSALPERNEIARLRAIPECVKDAQRLEIAYKQPNATSPVFANSAVEGQKRVTNGVAVYASVAAAKAALRRYDYPGKATCLKVRNERFHQESMQEQGTTDVDLEGVEARKLSSDALGDESVAFQVVSTFNISGSTVLGYADYEQIRLGRHIVTFTFSNVGSAFGAPRERLIRTVLKRL